MFSFWTCLQELRVCFALFRSCFGLCVSPAAVLDHEVAQLAAQVHRYVLPEPAAMDGDDDLHSEATTRVDWTTGERLREASTAESAVPEAPEVPEVPAGPTTAVPNPSEPVSAPAEEAPPAPADPGPEHEAPAEPGEVQTGEARLARFSQRLQLRQVLKKLDHCVMFRLLPHAPRRVPWLPSRLE